MSEDFKYANFVEQVRSIGEGNSKIFSVDLIPELEENMSWLSTVRLLESEGFVVAAITEDFPTGLYCAEGVENGRLIGWGIEDQLPTGILVTNIGWPFLSCKPEGPKTDGGGLKLVPHFVMPALFCRDGGWTEPIYLPYGSFSVRIADTTGIQYGQSGFEGCCAMRNEAGEVFSFRLDENAKRFDKTVRALDLPGVDVSDMEEMFSQTVAYNKPYVPKDGKLYIRPSVSGLNGGLGIIVPETSIITVEIAAFGNYLPESIKVEALKYVHRPPSGVNKIAPNYGASFQIKHGVKERGYNDYLSFDIEGNAEEVSTCAVGFIDDNGVFVIPPVQDEVDEKDRHILPSITRMSTMDILKASGESVEIRDVHFDEVSQMKGCFTMGNAVGVLHVSEICLRSSESDKGQVLDFNDDDIRQKIFSIRDKIYASRVGELEGFEDWAKSV